MKTVNEMTLEFPSKSANESFARAAVACFAAQLDPNMEELNDIKTAVSEAVTNCIVHAYRDTIGKITVKCRILPENTLDILVKDKGCGIENIEEDLYGLYQGDEPVSMNFWGFTPDFFDCLNDLFVDFLNKNQDNIKAEYPIPDVISYLMNNNKAQIKVLKCDAEWFGVTYKEDRPDVVERLKHVE